jgi:hypothetical protein
VKAMGVFCILKLIIKLDGCKLPQPDEYGSN